MANDNEPGPIPVILDTDIGDDIDDTWALAMLLNSPELDIKLVVTAYRNTTERAKIVARLLETAGRADIPIGIGINDDRTEDGMAQSPWVADYELASYPGVVHDDGVSAMVHTIESAAEDVTLIGIGPLTNVGVALKRSPLIARKTRFVGMQGSVRRKYEGQGGLCAEWNVRCDIPACQEVFSAPWKDILVTPLDTCGVVKLTGAKYQAVENARNPLTKALIDNYRIWYKDGTPSESSVLFDTVAIYLAFATDLLDMRRVGLRVTDDGYTLVDPSASLINCAVDWKDLGAFEDLVVARVCGD